jgi:V8-like Glu-specific endopeptidase
MIQLVKLWSQGFIKLFENYMKKITFLILTAFILSGCQDKSKEAQNQFDSDEIMYENGSDIVTKISASVVTIYAGDKLGSGVFITKDKVVTNYHVIEDIKEGQSIVIKQNNGSFFLADGVLVKDPDHDLAIIQFTNNDKKLDIAKLGNASNVKQGQEVYAIGSPKGLENTVTQGIISNSKVKNMLDGVTVFQHDASIDHGSSGGGLFDKKSGKLLAINFSILGESKQDAGFAVPVNYLKNILTINSIKVPLTKNDEFIKKIEQQYGGTAMIEGNIEAGSYADIEKIHFLLSSITTISGRAILFAVLFLLGYLIIYLFFRRSINKNKSPQKSLTSSSIGILIVFLVAMAFSFTDLIFTKSSNTPYQETEIVQ